MRIGEMAQQLRVLVAAEDLGLVPYNPLKLQFHGYIAFFGSLHGIVDLNTYRQNP